jgi:hypothetical protein
MQNIPRPGNPFFAAYRVALDWCDDIPAGQGHDDCVVGSLGSISLRAQSSADRIQVLETGLLIAALMAMVFLLSRRLIRR